MIDLRKNAKGRLQGDFFDRDGSLCRIAEDISPSGPCIRVGVANPNIENGLGFDNTMLLTQQQAAHLADLLEYFGQMGHLPSYID